MENVVDLNTSFPFKVKPFNHQLNAWHRSKGLKEYALFMDMGTGKTKVAIDTAAYLYLQGEIDTLVVFGNKGSYKNWINKEIPEHMPECIPVFSTYWESNPSKALSVTHELLLSKIKSLKIFVMNIEALAYPKSYKVVEDIVRLNKCLVVVDESTTIKNEGAARTKAAIKLGRLAKYRRILTGEPIANSPLDIWSQAKFLNPDLLGFQSYFAFRNCYAKLGDVRVGYRIIKQVQGFKNLKVLEENIARWSFRVKKEDCLDLPPKVYQTYTIKMTPEQRKVYDSIKKDSIAILSAQSITSTPLAITQLLRLHQVACGHIVDDEGKVYLINNNRIDTLMSILSEAEGKVIIWATYRSDITELEEAIGKEYGRGAVATYYGSTSDSAREAAVKDFQDPASPLRFFVGNPKTGGYGLTLTAATTVIYFSNNYELETRLQSEDRAHRIGQYKSVTYIDIVTEDSVDEKIIKALREKKKISAEILGDSWREWI